LKSKLLWKIRRRLIVAPICRRHPQLLVIEFSLSPPA
jgi:hypothetical protein